MVLKKIYYKALEKIDRKAKNNNFILTQSYNYDYYIHSYYKKRCIKDLIKLIININEWKKPNIRNNLF